MSLRWHTEGLTLVTETSVKHLRLLDSPQEMLAVKVDDLDPIQDRIGHLPALKHLVTLTAMRKYIPRTIKSHSMETSASYPRTKLPQCIVIAVTEAHDLPSH